MNGVQQCMTICAACKRVKDEDGRWQVPVKTMAPVTDVLITHGICPVCADRLYPQLYPRLLARHPEVFRKDR
jgi:hypothetical protein